MEPSEQSARLDLWRRMARGVGVVAVIFSLVVGALLTADWMHAGQAQTVRSAELSQVLAHARESPDSSTVALARDLDRMARHAYFSSVAFQNTGIWLLVLGLLVAVVCLHLAAQLGRRIEDPRRFPAADPSRADRAARLALLIFGVGCLLLLAIWGGGQAVKPAVIDASTGGASPVVRRRGTPPSNVVSNGLAITGAVPLQSSGISSRAAFQWNCFRGPCCGVSTWSNAPTSWDGQTGAGVLWHVPLSRPGISSPVLWGNRIFLTSADVKAREVVAYDAATGRELWRQVVADGGKGEALPTPRDSAKDMWAGLGVPTAACDDSGVYAVFGTGDLVAYSLDGKLRWQVYLHRPFNDYGHASSLVVADGRVCVQYDQKENGRVLAIDAQSGQTVWEQKRTPGASWSSPVVVAGADGKRMLLVNGMGALSAYEISSGRELWNVEGVTGDVAPSPACWNGRILVANAYARMVCYELAEKPAKTWEYSDALPDVASPVAADGLAFLATSEGQVACVDAKDGAGLWKHDYATGFYASPIVGGNRVYALDRNGTMRIFAAERKFREIASCPLGEGADATPAFADGRIYIRTTNTLWCVGTK